MLSSCETKLRPLSRRGYSYPPRLSPVSKARLLRATPPHPHTRTHTLTCPHTCWRDLAPSRAPRVSLATAVTLRAKFSCSPLTHGGTGSVTDSPASDILGKNTYRTEEGTLEDRSCAASARVDVVEHESHGTPN
ncbi:hypothetical protein MHYP_G00181540 [Metynnis hypsauchen]